MARLIPLDQTQYVNPFKHTLYTVSSYPDGVSCDRLAAALGTNLRHNTTLIGVHNLLEQLDNPSQFNELGFAGHGLSGLFDTGIGDTPSREKEKHVSTDIHIWEPMFELFYSKNIPLRILTCETGAGYYGALLLWEIAHHIKAPVYARTGLTWLTYGNVIFENNSTWQMASPSMPIPPKAIEKPKQKERVFLGKAIWISMQEFISINTITEVILVKNVTQVRISKSNIGDFFKNLVNGKQFLLGEDILGIITMELTISTSNNIYRVDIYNNRLAKFRTESVAFYINEEYLMGV